MSIYLLLRTEEITKSCDCFKHACDKNYNFQLLPMMLVDDGNTKNLDRKARFTVMRVSTERGNPCQDLAYVVHGHDLHHILHLSCDHTTIRIDFHDIFNVI